MEKLRDFAEARPLLFVIALAVLQPLIALPFVVAFRVAGLDIVGLRLLIPLIQSVFILWLIYALGWREKSGLTGPVRNVHLYWYPVLIAFAPVLFYGTIEISWGWIVFYSAALLFTGISEEGFARGIAIPALLRYGKWGALFLAAAIFSAGHITNIFFEDFGLIEWFDKFSATFGFAILYGAIFLRTGSLWPLIVLHAIHDYSYLTSGTAGPFMTEPIDIRLHMLLSLVNAAYGIFILARAGPEPRTSEAQRAAQDAA